MSNILNINYFDYSFYVLPDTEESKREEINVKLYLCGTNNTTFIYKHFSQKMEDIQMQ